MEYKQSEKQAVLDAIKNCSSSLSFDNLKAITGLGLMELSTLIGLLVKENRILVRFNHAKDKSYLYKSSNEALYDRFKDLLFLHRGKERKVAFYASELCISPKYLTAVVKECSGKTPTEWINETAIREIEYMLCHTQSSIKEIVNELKFPNLSFFGKYFKAHKGMSPKYYRTAYLNTQLSSL